MQLVYGQDETVAQWVANNLRKPLFCPPFVAIGVASDIGIAIGGMVFHDWNGANMEITIYGPRAMSRAVIRAAYSYVFLEAKATRLTAKTQRGNAIMKKLLPRLGFEFEGTMRGYYGTTRNDDALIFRLTPATAVKWI